MKNKFLNIFLFLCFSFLISCNEYSGVCIEAADFGDPKAVFNQDGYDVTERFPGQTDYDWFYSSWPNASGYTLNGDKIIAKLSGAWTNWNEEISEDSTYANVTSANKVCLGSDFYQCVDTSGDVNTLIDGCMQPNKDVNNEEKICWFAQGIGLYVVLTVDPTSDKALYFHFYDYLEESPEGLDSGWYFVLENPNRITDDDGDEWNTTDYFGVSDISQVKIYTYVHNYNYSTNITGCLVEGADPYEPADGDIEECSSNMAMTFIKGAGLEEPMMFTNLAEKLINQGLKIVEAMYIGIIESTYLKEIITISLTLYISYLGIAFLLGLTQLGHKELLFIIIRIGIIYTLISTSYSSDGKTYIGWDYYENYFVNFFWYGTQELATEVMSAVNTSITDHVIEYNQDLMIYNADASVFETIDDILIMFLSSETHTKIWALMLTHQFGIFIIILLYACIFNFMLAIFKFSIALLMVFFSLIVMLALGPIMVIFMLFEFTRGYFMGWIQKLLGLFIQPMLFLVFLGAFLSLISFYLLKVLYFQVCWQNICCGADAKLSFGSNSPNVLGFWKINDVYEYDDDEASATYDTFIEVGSYAPNYYDLFLLFLMSTLLRYYADIIPQIAEKISGGFSLGNTAGGASVMLSKGAFKIRNFGLGAAKMVTGKVGRMAIVNTANAAAPKGVASMISGTKANNLAKAKRNVTNNLKDKGYTDAMIKKHMEGAGKEQFKKEFKRLQAKSDESNTLSGMVGSVAEDFKQGGVTGGMMGLGNRLLASARISDSFDFRAKGMSKAQNERLKEGLSGTGAYKQKLLRGGNRKFEKKTDDYFEKATSKGDKEPSRFSSAVSNVTDTAFKPIARRLDAIASRGQETVNMFSESGRKRNRGNIEKATAELREKIDRDVGGRSNVTNRDSDVSDEYHGVEESKGSQTDDYEASQSQSSSSPASQATSENRKKIVKKAKKAKKGKKEKTKSQARSRYGDFSGAASSTGESLRDGASAIKKSSYESLYSAGRETAAYAVASKRRVGGALARKAVSGNDYLKGKVQSAHNMVGSKIGISPQYKKPTTTMDSSTSGIDSREVEDAKFDELQTDEDIQALDTSAAAQAPDTSAAAPAPDISAAAPASDIPAADSSTPISVSDTNTASSARTGTEDGARTTLRKTLESETAGLDGDEDKALSERDSLKAELANTTPEDKEGI